MDFKIISFPSIKILGVVPLLFPLATKAYAGASTTIFSAAFKTTLALLETIPLFLLSFIFIFSPYKVIFDSSVALTPNPCSFADFSSPATVISISLEVNLNDEPLPFTYAPVLASFKEIFSLASIIALPLFTLIFVS